MSMSSRTSYGTMRTLCRICVMLLCISQIQSDSAPVSKEGLREEHLLPVRLSRAAGGGGFEGSGDEDSTPIRALGSGIMERMTLKTDEEVEDEDNKVVHHDEDFVKPDESEASSSEDLRSVETVENIDEGSGLDEATPRTAAIVATNAVKDVDAHNATEVTTDKEHETTTLDAVEKNSSESSGDVEISTAKEEAMTTVTPKAAAETEIAVVVTTVREEATTVPDITTVREISLLPMKENKEATTVPPETVTPTEISQEPTLGPKDMTTVLPDVEVTEMEVEGRTEAERIAIKMDEKLETTTVKEETVTPTPAPTVKDNHEDVDTEKAPEPVTVTEQVEVKHVEPVFAAEVPETTKKAEEEVPVTELVEVKHVEPVFAAEVPETTKKAEEEVPVTELVEVKHVEPVIAAEVPETTKELDEDVKTEVTTTAIPAVTVVVNGTLLENENLTAETDTLLMKIKSRLLDTNETVLNSSKDPSRLGTYIVVSLILLSFLSLIGFVLMKRRVQKRRKKSSMDPETLDTEKALLSLSEYKDHPDGVDEGKIKNNEITPIVIKSNSQINKFEKNTNFSSPKNLNTKANEKNIEKDNVLKKASDNLTQVIIEEPMKDMEEDKVPTNAEKLIVRTHLDQDSIPKKPVIVNRTSLGCLPVSQD